MYQNNAWRALRLEQLKREPLCRFCKSRGVITVATVCDHIEPHRGDLEKFWAEGNFQSLCADCHNVTKKRMENGWKEKPHIGLDGWPE
jgi:5-methylcytosine-specific restriction endonuclease McrA